MKRVRFQTPTKVQNKRMDEPECHSPRHFIERRPTTDCQDFYERILPYSNDPVQSYESSNSSPYPMVTKTSVAKVCDRGSEWLPSNDLELSMLDASSLEPRQQFISKQTVLKPAEETLARTKLVNPQVLTPIENKVQTPPNVLSKDNSFFIRRNELDKYRLETNLNLLNLDKENEPLAKKAEIIGMGFKPIAPEQLKTPQFSASIEADIDVCNCHHCVVVAQNNMSYMPQCTRQNLHQHRNNTRKPMYNQYHYMDPQAKSYFHCQSNMPNFHETCHCNTLMPPPPPCPQNAVDRKTLAIQKYEGSKKTECMDIQKQTNVVKEKREPTVADLFKIIKLQNEQLQLLQEKVDKFISTSNKAPQNVHTVPIQNYMTEQVAVKAIDSEISEQHKISIGVMTSFEMVRTSTVINQEFVKQTKDNAQVQCNRSQISIKEVMSKTQPVNLNFLEGILPVDKASVDTETSMHKNDMFDAAIQQAENAIDDKIINDMSLYNVQVDNATTPLISPEQSMYLEVRDYSDSDSSDDQSKVGWTYYNKVMTHVNGMLQDSDMPSSASALCRNMRQQCVQMQIDKTNISVTKRVKFGDDPLGIQQPHIYAASTDTSMKMNQLAAKYLKAAPTVPLLPTMKPATKDDISFATRNYMERHKLLQGSPVASRSPEPGEMPRFLDITALKQQTKLL